MATDRTQSRWYRAMRSPYTNTIIEKTLVNATRWHVADVNEEVWRRFYTEMEIPLWRRWFRRQHEQEYWKWRGFEIVDVEIVFEGMEGR